MGQISPFVGGNHEPESEFKEEARQDEAANRTRTVNDDDDIRYRMSVSLRANS